MTALGAGDPIDVELASGAWDADPATGHARPRLSIMCLDGSGPSVEVKFTGWTWRGATATLEGTYGFDCAP